jgi:general secretion pathway protein D
MACLYSRKHIEDSILDARYWMLDIQHPVSSIRHRVSRLMFCIFILAICSLLLVYYLYCGTPAAGASALESVAESSGDQRRPAIVDRINPVYLPKTTALEIFSDRQLTIKQVRLSKGGTLLIEVFGARTSLPDSISINKGILRSVALETEGNELRVYVNLTEPVVYDVESADLGLKVIFQNPILEQLVSIDVNEEPLTTVMLMLFTQYGANIVAGSKVTGKVTAHLVDVPLKAALDEILRAEGYGYMQEGELIRVLPITEIEEMQAEADEDLRLETSDLRRRSETRLFQLEFANAKDMEDILKELVGSEGSVLIDQRTNSVIIVASVDEIERVEKVIKQLDKEVPWEEEKPAEPSPEELKAAQEAMIAEQIVKKVFRLQYLDPENARTILEPLLSEKGTIAAVKEEKKETGGSGAGVGGTGGGGVAGMGTGQEIAVGQGGYLVASDTKEVVERIEEEIQKLDVPVPQVAIDACIVEGSLSEDTELGINWMAINEDEDLSLSFSSDMGVVLTKGIIPVEKFTGILNALHNSSDLKVLSNPSITTLQGQAAMFHSGDKIPYSRIFIQEGIQQVDTVFEEVGIVLTATPYVKEGDMISLLLTTSVSSEGGFTPAGQPRISTRTTRSQVLVKSGDTVAIAGLIADRNSIVVSKVPLIGDIPLIGRVFSTHSEVKQRNEVTIFITPKIVISNQLSVISDR